MSVKNHNLKLFSISLEKLEMQKKSAVTEEDEPNFTNYCISNTNRESPEPTLTITIKQTTKHSNIPPSSDKKEVLQRIRHIISVLAQYNKLKKTKDKVEFLNICYEGSKKWEMLRRKSAIDKYYFPSELVSSSKSPQKPSNITKNTNSKKKSYICLFCFKNFTTKGAIDVHSKLHSGEQPPFLCAHCPAAFYRKQQCQKHIESHNNKCFYSYCCHRCLKIFKRSYELLLHEHEEHAVAKRHRCRFCLKKFRAKQICERHEMIYHQGFFHICRTCSQKFASNLALVIHRQKHCGKTHPKTVIYNIETGKENSFHRFVEADRTEEERSKSRFYFKFDEKNINDRKNAPPAYKSNTGMRKSARSCRTKFTKNKSHEDVKHICRFC